MPSYTQRGLKKCPKCKTETENKKCPICGAATQGTGPWVVRFRTIENGARINKRLSKDEHGHNFLSKKEAQAAYEAYVKEHKNESKVIADSFIFDELLKRYLKYDATLVRESTTYDKENVFALHITPYFTGKRIDKLTKIDILDWLDKINELISEKTKKPYSFKYKEKIRGYMFSFLTFCEDFFDIPNVMKRLKTPRNKPPKKEMQFYVLEEFNALCDVIDDIMWKSFFMTLYYSGMRIGEMLALSDKDINIQKETIKIDKSLTRKTTDGSPYKITPPKNKSSIRTISIPKVLSEQLKYYFDYKRGNNISGTFLFGGEVPIAENTYMRRLATYANTAGIKKIRIHDFRHSHASLFINLGANVVLVSKRLGHSTPNETLATYGHLFPSSEPDIVHKLDDVLGAHLGAKK